MFRRTGVLTLAAVASLVCGAALAAHLYVPDDYLFIQDAIDAALPGDTVWVAPGLYTENIVLRSGVDVRGEETALTLLQADRLDLPVVVAQAAQDVLFANFTVLDSDDGIRIIDSDAVIVANNVFDTLDGIAIDTDAASTVDVLHNVFFDNIVAVRRGSVRTWVVNNVFSHNVTTLTGSAFVDRHAEVRHNCFFANDDLMLGGNDTALGTNARVGDPRFVDTPRGDFHLRLGSPCIDAGEGFDAIDNTVADIGAYGGAFADPWPFPVPAPVAVDTSTGPAGPFNIELSWQANLDHRVTNQANPGSYRVYYSLNAPGPPYDGTDSGTDTEPSPIEVGNVSRFELTDLNPAALPPLAPASLSALPRNRGVLLEWAKVDGAAAYRIHYGVDTVDQQFVEVGDVDSHFVSGLPNDVEHRFALTALGQATYYLAVTVLDNTPERHESLLSDEAVISIGPVIESPRSAAVAATPRAQRSDDDRCFIATAAYASPFAAEVLALRDFRDRYLMSHAFGRAFVAGYYEISPHIARALDRHAWLQAPVRFVLTPLVAFALLMLGASPGATLGVLLLAGGLITVRRRTGRRFTATAVPSGVGS